ncbi:MAG: hypothetical protein J6Y82_00045 [Bacteroidales bacterium]|nr:hypothetical protein [Bacteroidales bacterium]
MKTKYPFYYTYLFLAVIVSLLTSCNDDDETYNVVGLWQLYNCEIGTNKHNTEEESFNDMRSRVGDLFVQLEESGSIRELRVYYTTRIVDSIHLLTNNLVDSIIVKDGTYSTDGKTITTIIEGKVKNYTIEDSKSISYNGIYYDHNNAYFRCYFQELRYDYQYCFDYDGLVKEYISVPSQRHIELEKKLSGCYESYRELNIFYWFYSDGNLMKRTKDYDDDNYQLKTIKEEYGKYTLYSNNDSLAIDINGVITKYQIAFRDQKNVQLKITDENKVVNYDLLFPVEDDLQIYQVIF